MVNRRSRGRGGLVQRLARVLLLVAPVLGCAPTQMVALHAGPEPLVLFVDGERLDRIPPELELKATADHTLFFQREGYRSQLIVVRTSEREGEPRLEPAAVQVRLKRVARSGPEISVEVDE